MQLAELLITALGQVWGTLIHNWPFLVVSIFVAAAMKLYVKTDAVAAFLRRRQKGGVLIATAAAVGTPLCSCGTTAIVLGMMAGSMPWAPIIAFMVASPLTSPEELIYSAGLFGWPFAIAFFAASIVLGLAGGVAGSLLDTRGWLRNQSRFAPARTGCQCATGLGDDGPSDRPAPAPVAVLPLFAVAAAPCACTAEASGVISAAPGAVDCSCCESATARQPGFEWWSYLTEVVVTGRRLLLMFLAFATIGYLINDLIPAAWISSLFGSGRAYSVPLAATLGLPFYINTEASLPLVRGMLDAGMSSGAALAFLITGAGTSIGAVAGAMAIARWRVVGLVIVTLWLGAILCGFAYEALSAAGTF